MPINSTHYNMRTINSNPLSKLKEEKVVPLLEERFVLGVSNIIWEYYCILENNILYVDSKYIPNIKFDNKNNKWESSWANPLKTLLFNVNRYYKFVVAGGYPMQLLIKNAGTRISIDTDIDVFLVCTNIDAPVEVKQKARENAINYLIQHIYKHIPTPAHINARNNILRVIIQKHVLTFYNSRMRPIQLITCEYESTNDIFKYFDISAPKCAYDGKFIIDDDAFHDLQCSPPQMSILRKSPSMPYRILKYMSQYGLALNLDENVLDNSDYLTLLGIDKYIVNVNNLSDRKHVYTCNIQGNIDKVNDKSTYDYMKGIYDVLATNIKSFARGETTKYIETIDIYDPDINNYQLLFHKNLPELKYQITGDGTLNPIVAMYCDKFKKKYSMCILHNMHNIFTDKMREKYLNYLLQNVPQQRIDVEIYADFEHSIRVYLSNLEYTPPTFSPTQREDNIFYTQFGVSSMI